MTALPSHGLILAAGPAAPGAREALAALAPRPAVLLTGAGLDWLTDAVALASLRGAAADVALCSASARDRGLTADGTPVGVRWSSVATWLAQREGGAFGLVLP